MFNQIETILASIANDPDLLKTWARLYRRMIDELEAAKFSHEDAVTIVTTSPILSFLPTQKSK